MTTDKTNFGSKYSYEVAYFTRIYYYDKTTIPIFSYITGDYSYFAGDIYDNGTVRIKDNLILGDTFLKEGEYSDIEDTKLSTFYLNSNEREFFLGKYELLSTDKRNTLNLVHYSNKAHKYSDSYIDISSLYSGLYANDNIFLFGENLNKRNFFNQNIIFNIGKNSIGYNLSLENSNVGFIISDGITYNDTTYLHNSLEIFTNSDNGTTTFNFNSSLWNRDSIKKGFFNIFNEDDNGIKITPKYNISYIPFIYSQNKYNTSFLNTIPSEDDNNGIITNIKFGIDSYMPEIYEVYGNVKYLGITYTRVNLESSAGNGSGTKVTPTIGNDIKYELPEISYRFITNISQNSVGKITYTYTDIYTPKLSLGTDKLNGNATNDKKNFIIKTEVNDHQITNTYGAFSYAGTNFGVIFGVSIDSTGKISYASKSMAVTTGTKTNKPGETTYTKLGKDGSGSRFITDIKQNADGTITYTYNDYYTPELSLEGNSGNFVKSTSVSDHKITHTYGAFAYTGTNSGVIFGVSIDSTGKISYASKSMAVNIGTESLITGNSASQLNDSASTGNRFISNIKQNADGTITYTYGDIYSPKLSKENNNTGDFIKGINVDNHKISYIYGSFSNAGTSNGPITNVHIDKDGKLSYTSTALTINSGVEKLENGDNASQLTNDVKGYRFISNISQKADGTITYTYGDINTPQLSLGTAGTNGNATSTKKDFIVSQSVSNHEITNTYGAFAYTGTNSGVIFGVSIDSTGKISYASKSMAVTTGTKINPGNGSGTVTQLSSTSTTGHRFINNIKQNADGTITYTYTDIYTPNLSIEEDTANHTETETLIPNSTTVDTIKNITVNGHQITYLKKEYILPTEENYYTYHKLTLNKKSTNSNSVPTTNTVDVLYGIVTDNNNTTPSKEHNISYETVTVLTEAGFENKLANFVNAFNGIIYAGTYTFNSNKTSGTFDTSGKLPTGLTTYQCGYVFVATNSGTFMGQTVPVAAGDFIFLNEDTTTATMNNASKWKVINRNLNLSNTGTSATSKVITNVSLTEDGTFTYTYTDLETNSGTDSLSTGNSATQLTDSSTAGHRFISNISQNSSGKITYTYGDIYSPKLSKENSNTGHFINGINVDNHKITYNYGSFSTIGTNEGAVFGVSIDSTGKISYASKSMEVKNGVDSLYTGNTATELTDSSTAGHRFISNIYQKPDGKISYTYGDIYSPKLSLGNGSGDFIKSISVSDHQITNTYGTFSTVGTNEGAIFSVSIDSTGKISYASKSMAVTTGTSAQNSHKVITNIKQSADGKITYTYSDLSNEISINNNTNALSGNQLIYESHIELSNSTYTLKNSYISWWGNIT